MAIKLPSMAVNGWKSYLFAIAAVLAALAIRLTLAPYLGDDLRYATFVVAVTVVAWHSGAGPAIAAMLTGAAALDYFFLAPRNSFGISGTNDLIAFAAYFFITIPVIFLAQRQRRDATALSKTQERLLQQESTRKSEEQFRILADAIPQLCWIANSTGWIFWYNQRWYDYTGTTPHQMEGWGWQSVHDPEVLPQVLERWKSSIETGEAFDMVFPLKGADGLFRPFLTRVMPVRGAEGRIVRWFGTNTDISEQKRTEAELEKAKSQWERSAAQLRTILESMSERLYVCDGTGNPILINENARKSYRLEHPPGDEKIGAPSVAEMAEQVDSFASDGRLMQFSEWPISRVLRGEKIQAVEIKVTFKKSNHTRVLSCSGAPILDRDGKVAIAILVSADITERKQAEEDVRKGKDLLEKFIREAPIGLVAFDRKMRYLQVSRRWLENSGLGEVELTGKSHYEVFPELRESWKEAHRRGLAGESVRGEEDWITADGCKRWISWAIHPWGDDGESTGGIILVSEDITERKQAEEAIRRQADLLRLSFDAVIVWKLGGTIESWNVGAQRLYGFTESEALGRVTHDLLQTIHPKPWAEIEAEVMHNRFWEGELIHRAQDGREITVSARMQLISYADGTEHLLEINRDITERKQMETALRASEERWATTLQSIGDAVISTDADGKIVFMNEVAEKLTGWPLAKAKDAELGAVFNIVQEVTRIRPENPVAKVIRTGKVVGLANHTMLIHHDGREIPIEDSGAPIRNREGKIEGVVMVFHDVSEQRKMERAVRTSDRLATTGRLAATIAHEIHNPLDTVGNLLFLVQKATKEEMTRQHISMAAEELARVTQITQQMLSFQRESAKPLPVRFDEIFNSVIALYQRKLDTAGIQVRVETNLSEPMLAQPGELRQVFANLVGNAIEALGREPGVILLRAHPAREWLHGRMGVRVLVADNGRGIPSEFQEKIFDPFFTTKGESGTGLGLWITSDILRKYEGTIRLRSTTRAGRNGTCFSLFFPLASAEPQSEPIQRGTESNFR